MTKSSSKSSASSSILSIDPDCVDEIFADDLVDDLTDDLEDEAKAVFRVSGGGDAEIFRGFKSKSSTSDLPLLGRGAASKTESSTSLELLELLVLVDVPYPLDAAP